jgi:hypothetical protein
MGRCYAPDRGDPKQAVILWGALTMPRLSKDELARIKEDNPLDEIVEKHVKLSRASAKGIRAGQCICEPKRGKSPLWVNPAKGTWGCKYGSCGGDTFTFLERFEGLDFRSALAMLFGGEVVSDPALAARLEEERLARKAEREKRETAQAEDERRKAYEMWGRGTPVADTLADAYFRHRGLEPVRSKALRFNANEPYYCVPDELGADPIVVHRGPCLYAAIQGPDGRFLGLHRTWLDPRLGAPDMPPKASGKAQIFAPDGTPMVAKKMRGGKQGGAIRLHDFVGERDARPRVFIAGEGIETTETVYQALVRYGDPSKAYFAYAAGDLGNLSGGGLGLSTPHPEKRNRLVPPDEPDPSAPSLMPPEWATSAILLGDSDSDSYVTGARLRCAQKRWRKAGCPTVIRMADPTLDFNDMVRGAA